MTWHVGGVTIEAVVETEVVAATEDFIGHSASALDPYRSWLAPFLSDDGNVRMIIQALLVSVDGLRIVVDTCVGNGRDYGPIVPTFNNLDTPFLENLAAAGFAPDAVDLVICTHLHMDHVGWNTMLVDNVWTPTFPRACYVMSRCDLDHWQHVEAFTNPFDVSVQPLLDRGLVDAVDAPHRISASVSLLATPGHTPGHVSVQIESNGARAMITGDMVHSPVQFVRPEWSSVADTDREAATRTREQVRDVVGNTDVLIIGTHFPSPTVGHLVSDATGQWRFE